MKTQTVFPYLLPSVTLQPGVMPTESGSGTSLSCGFCINDCTCTCLCACDIWLFGEQIDVSVKQHTA